MGGSYLSTNSIETTIESAYILKISRKQLFPTKVFNFGKYKGYIIHEVFENEKKKGGLIAEEPSLELRENSIIKEALYLLTPQLP